MSINDLLAMSAYTALINFRLQYYEFFLKYLLTVNLIANKLYTLTIIKTSNRLILHIQIPNKDPCIRVVDKISKHIREPWVKD